MTKSGWIIYRKIDAKKNKSYIDWFIDECKQQGIELTVVYRENLTIGILNSSLAVWLNGKQVTPPSFAVIRTVEPLLNDQLEQMGVAVFNSSKVATICNHKSYTYQTIAALGIPMVTSLFVSKDLLAKALPMPVPFVVKTVNGRGGRQVKMIATTEQWENFMLHPPVEDLVIQACDVQLGKDLRVYVVGREIVGAVLRQSDSDFRANYALGGQASWYELSPQQVNIVQKIIDHFDFGMVGIDFLFDQQGNLLFNEIEDVVGSRMLSEVSDVNIVKKYVELIKSKL